MDLTISYRLGLQTEQLRRERVDLCNIKQPFLAIMTVQ